MLRLQRHRQNRAYRVLEAQPRPRYREAPTMEVSRFTPRAKPVEGCGDGEYDGSSFKGASALEIKLVKLPEILACNTEG